MGAESRRHRGPRLDTRTRLSATPMGRLQRSVAAVYPWTRIRDASASEEELSGVDQDVCLEAPVWPRVRLRRSAVHASVVACLDRFTWHPGRLHATPRARLLQEQPARDLCTAAVRDSESQRVCRVR